MSGRKRSCLTTLVMCLSLTILCVSCCRACFVLPKKRVIRQFYTHQESFDTIAAFISGYDKSGLGEPQLNRSYPYFWIGEDRKPEAVVKNVCDMEIRVYGESTQVAVEDEAILHALQEVMGHQRYHRITEPGFENQCIYFWARCSVIDEACGVVYTKDGEEIREAFGIPVVYTERLDDHWFYWEGDHNDGR